MRHTRTIPALIAPTPEEFTGMWDRIDNQKAAQTREYKMPRIRMTQSSRKPPFKAWRKAHRDRQDAV